jgi:DNA gyrase/topoisomerase IV subunit B
VGAEDTASADEMFSILMGDAVEPRALDVKYLDI